VESKLLENRLQSRRLSCLQVVEGGIMLIWHYRARDAISLRRWDLPQVRHLVVDEPDWRAVPRLVYPLFHRLWRDGAWWYGAQTKRMSWPARKFVDSAPCLAAVVCEVGRTDSFFTSLLALLVEPRMWGRRGSSRISSHWNSVEGAINGLALLVPTRHVFFATATWDALFSHTY